MADATDVYVSYSIPRRYVRKMIQANLALRRNIKRRRARYWERVRHGLMLALDAGIRKSIRVGNDGAVRYFVRGK